jgi:hypothetical protein
MKSWLSFLQISFIVLMLPGCSPERKQTLMKRVVFAPKTFQTSIDTNATVDRQHVINVWIHGTRLFYAPPLQNFLYSTKGLHRACEYDSRYHMHDIGKILGKSAPHIFPPESFYIFGWSGKLDFGVREKAAKDLYEQLVVAQEEYEKKHGVKPMTRVITHSHGGNVMLNVARLEGIKPDFYIDELILLACPVQDKTASLIKSPIFKKIFAIYSHLDLFQILDPQGLYKSDTKTSSLLSGRYFPEQENLEQVTIKMNGRAIFHGEFVFPRFLAFLADIIGEMENWHKEITEPKPFTKFIKMLHVRTNGKPFKFARSKKKKPEAVAVT